MTLFVLSPGHIDSLKELLKAKEKICNFFMAGSTDYIGTGRSNRLRFNGCRLCEFSVKTFIAY